MISVAMGGENRVNEKTRDWFDKAAKAQIDFIPAYRSYIWSIYPRWGGSHQEMFQFGLECLQTNRYGTTVPYELMTVLDDINSDTSGDYAVYAVPQVRVAVRQLMSNMIEKSKSERDKYWYASYQNALAWRTRQYAEAAQLLDKYADHLSEKAFAALKGWAPYAISEIRAMNSSQSPALAAAAKAAEAQDYDAAATQLRGASSNLAKDDPGQFFIKYRAKLLENERDYVAGKSVSLAPDESFAPWQVISGDWKMDKEGAFVCTTDKSGNALLICREDFGPAYELQAKVDGGDPRHFVGAGLAFNYDQPPKGNFAVFDIAAGNVVSNTFNGMIHQDLKLAPGDTITVQVVGSQYNVLVNGKPALSQPVQKRLAGNLHVGLIIVKSTPGSVVKFEDVQIRRGRIPGQ